MVIAGAGAVDHGQLVSLAKEKFGKIPSTPSNKIEPVMEPARFTGSDILIRYDDMPQAYIAYGFPTAGWKDPDNFALMLIQTMLGSWEKSVHGGVHSSSPLISTVAQYELAHSISAFNTQYSDTGLFGVYAVADPVTLNNLMFAITRTISNLSYNVEENALLEAKNQLKMNMLAHLDGSTVIAEDIGRQLLTYGRRMHPSEMIARIDAVDAAQIKATARRYFQDRDHALAAIGPIWELPDYNWIRARSYQHLI
jgi:processing peptidase subunit beta